MQVRRSSVHKHLIKAILLIPSSAKGIKGVGKVPAEFERGATGLGLSPGLSPGYS